MPTEFIVTLDDPSVRSSLRKWLDESDGLQGRYEVLPTAVPPGQLGAELEIVRLLLEGGGVVTVVIESIALWLHSRRSDVSVAVSIGHKKVNMSSASLRNASVEDIEKLVRGIVRELIEE
jgi:hypothetical protein